MIEYVYRGSWIDEMMGRPKLPRFLRSQTDGAKIFIMGEYKVKLDIESVSKIFRDYVDSGAREVFEPDNTYMVFLNIDKFGDCEIEGGSYADQ